MDKEKKNENKEKEEIKEQPEKKNDVKNEREANKEKELNEQISKLKDELEDVKDRHTRLIAEFDNLKKRSAKEREGLYNSIIGDIMSSLLPVIDNLEKATEAESKDEEYKKGIELVLKQFKDVLNANGVKEIEAVGQPFDPELHEAVSMIQDENFGEKVVAQEYRKGYMIGNKVIRHSMVVVAN
ncbi:MAG: nucleotide exchange factor GrpE [Clostridia bacterium]